MGILKSPRMNQLELNITIIINGILSCFRHISHPSNLFRCNECIYQLTCIWEVPLWGIFILSVKHKKRKQTMNWLWPCFAALIPQFSLIILSSSECISWIDMQWSSFHFTPNKANTSFVWIRFKMSESAYIYIYVCVCVCECVCVNCKYTDSQGCTSTIIVAVLSYLSNYSLYPVRHTGLCLSLCKLYSKSRAICSPTIFIGNMAINNKSTKLILFNISIIERNVGFKPLVGHRRC